MTGATVKRFLVPGELIELESGLWVVDVTQPVAAVLDPATGAVRRVVSWRHVPPPGPGWRYRTLLGDGTSLWVQQQDSGPVARVDADGIGTAVWTNGLRLLACGGGAVWCGTPPPAQEVVSSPHARPRGEFDRVDRLLRIEPGGETQSIRVSEAIRSVHATSDALLVEVDVDPWSLSHLGGDMYEVEHATRWLRLPWDADIPDRLSIESHGQPEGHELPGPTGSDDGGAHPTFHRFDREAAAEAREWASQWDIGEGRLLAAASAAGRPVILVSRQRHAPYQGHQPVDLVALGDPPAEVTVLLAADALDISDHGWPLVPRPLDADSYVRQIRRTYDLREDPWQDDVPIAERQPEPTNCRTAITGDWPDTTLEWTFDWPERPGVRIRRKIRLFDELGRIEEPEYAHVHLEEDLATRTMPPVTAARDGIIDI